MNFIYVSLSLLQEDLFLLDMSLEASQLIISWSSPSHKAPPKLWSPFVVIFCGRTSNDQKTHNNLIAWDFVCLPKSEGGPGLRRTAKVI